MNMSLSSATKHLKWFLLCAAMRLVREIQLRCKVPPLPEGWNFWKMRIRNVRLENFLIKKAATVCSRHFLSADVIQGGRRCSWEGAVPVLFASKYCSLPLARLTVWERTQHLEDEVTEQEKMAVESVQRSRHDTRTSSFSCSTLDFYGHHWPAEHF